ncbi:MAG: ABC transporter ATP-binding protein [Planctomycetales bacterium]|nr:ABC transporter ATP-binding protein [Planctomycetales bacterium]
MKSQSDSNHQSWRRSGQLLAPYLSPYRWRLAVAMACLFAAVTLRVVEPLPLQYILDHVLVASLSGNVAIAADDAMAVLAVCAVAVVMIATVRALLEYGRAVMFAWVGNQVVTRLRTDVFQHLQSLSMAFHNRSRTGDLTIRLVGDLNMLRDVAVTAVLPMIASTMIMIGMSIVMLWIHLWLGLIAISIFPMFWFAATRGSRKIHQAAKQQRSREGALAATANESLSAVRVVQTLSLERRFADTFGGHSKKSMKEGVKTSRLAAALERKVDVLIAFASAVVLWQGARYVLAGEMSVGGLVVFLAYLKRGFKPLQDFAKYTGRISKALAGADRVMEILEQRPAVSERADAVDAPTLRGHVEFRDVSFGYLDRRPVLSKISFTVQPGERVAIVGASGAGKSTILSLASRLHDPDKGTVLIDGTDIRSWTIQSIRRQQSIVMQDNAVFATTVRDNIAIVEPDATDEQVETSARAARAHEFIEKLPQGYDTIVGERGTTMSRGQAQRLAIARATMRPLPIFLVDEPTTGLDRNNERLVVDGILRASRGRTTLIVTHQMELAAQADRILVLQDGEIIEDGSHRDLIQQHGAYAAMYMSQQTRNLNHECALQQ